MDCPRCSERTSSTVKYCRKCGIELVAQQSEVTTVSTKKLDEPPFFFPAAGRPVEPIASVVFASTTDANQTTSVINSLFNIPEITDFPEEALPFTLDPVALQIGVDKVLQPRGLLQIKESYEDEYDRHKVKVDHIDLFFARAENVMMTHVESNLHTRKAASGHERIRLNRIESVAYKRSFLSASLIMTLSPSEWYCNFLKVDHVTRQVVLQISRKDANLAKQLASAVSTNIARRKLEGALNPKPRNRVTRLG